MGYLATHNSRVYIIIEREREGERERERERERILPFDCMMLYVTGFTMYTVHVSIAHWIHYSTADPTPCSMVLLAICNI